MPDSLGTALSCPKALMKDPSTVGFTFKTFWTVLYNMSSGELHRTSRAWLGMGGCHCPFPGQGHPYYGERRVGREGRGLPQGHMEGEAQYLQALNFM